MRTCIYWKAIYQDGTSLCQFEEDGTENKYPDIDRSKLATFEIRKAAAGEQKDRLFFKMFLEPGRRLIYRRRVLQKMRFGKAKPELVSKETIYLVGWQATIEGKNVQDIAYVFEDGHVELAGQWREAPYDSIGTPIPAETQCYDERHFTVDAVVVKREKKATAADAILVKKVQLVVGGAKHNADTIARTESHRAMTQSIKQSYRDTGKVKKVKFITAGDDVVRPSHAALNGHIFNLNNTPSQLEEPNCRCTIVAYFGGK